MQARLAVQALENAVQMRGDVAGCIVHSDRGSQGGFNRSSQHPDRKGDDGTTSGMVEGADGPESDDLSRASRHSAGYRAGVLEDRHRWASRDQLRIAIVTWVERTYHRRRKQASLGRLTPVEFEAIMNTTVALAA